MSQPNCPRLIEVALPIREISAESLRQKKAQRGHISTLHLWWARRPLSASRAVVFASLVPDPDDPQCPTTFRLAVEQLLRAKVPGALKAYRRGKDWHNDPDPFRPYEGIADTPRNRLLTFIAKWSPEKLAFDAGKSAKEPKTTEMLDDRCLVKWETADPDNSQGQEILRIARELVTVANSGLAPTLLDPFSGGGAIPLEAARLGCKTIANDYNPVAYLILRATCEFPQKHGKRLMEETERWAKWILERVRERVEPLYPPGNDGKPVVGYIWARTAPCSNPACRAEIPLIRSLLVCDKGGKRVAITLSVKGREAVFGVSQGKEATRTEGTMLSRGDCRCPFCQQTTPVKELRRAGLEGKMGERMVAVIIETPEGRSYRPVEPTDLAAFSNAQRIATGLERPGEYVVPEINAPTAAPDAGAHASIRIDLYGFKTFGSLFNPRQLVAMQALMSSLREAVREMRTLKENTQELESAVAITLGLWISRASARFCTVTVWHKTEEKFEHPFGRQTIPMTWDYPEPNPLADGSAGLSDAWDLMRRVIDRERATKSSVSVLLNDAARLPLNDGTVDCVVTDPPYFDSIAYADLSDFFYVWLKRGLSEVVPEALSTPQTPKMEEAVAHKHRHHGNREKGKEHFERKLRDCFAEARRLCREHGVIAVMFAHQSTEAWTALVNALFQAGLNITATYPVDTELTTALKGEVSALESSITVICRSRKMGGAASFKEVRKEIEKAVRESVHRFWNYGFRGADLIVACYGPAVGVFGKHERVERLDGSVVEVPELLETARELALKAISGEFEGDALSRLYFVWANQYGIAPQSYDDLVKVAQMGMDTENAADLAHQRGLFVADGPTCRLALLRDRTEKKHLGDEPDAPLIDKLHHALHLWKAERRPELVRYLKQHDLLDDAAYWKLAQALFEVLPRGEEDWKLVSALLTERETLQSEAKRVQVSQEQELL